MSSGIGGITCAPAHSEEPWVAIAAKDALALAKVLRWLWPL
jgi:hypothetical protein